MTESSQLYTEGGRTDSIFSKIRKIRYPISLFLNNTVLSVVARVMRQELGIKGTQIKEKLNYLCLQMIRFNAQNHLKIQLTLSELKNYFSKVQEYKTSGGFSVHK